MPDTAPGFDCRLHLDGKTSCVAPVGELDVATVGIVEENIERAVSDGARRLVLDLGGLTFMASTGLRLVLELVKRRDDGEFELAVVPGPRPVQRVFELTRTDDRVPWADG